MKKIISLLFASVIALSLSACGTRVEVPPAHLGKIMTKSGYMDGTKGTSKFRLDPCLAYCDKLVILDVSDKAYVEEMEIFIPEDKLKLKIAIRTNLTLSPKKAEGLFSTIPPEEGDDSTVARIPRDAAYKIYAQQIILTETREYLSKYSIAQIASSLEKVNSDLRERLTKALSSNFDVRYVGITNIAYPEIITEAQENAARRREQIEQENAQLEVSRVQLERQLQEAQLQRRIDVEKATADAEADRIRAIAASNPAVIKLRELENQRAQIDKWDGKLPQYVLGSGTNTLMNIPQSK